MEVETVLFCLKEYCAGHKGIKGNEEADRLAREGALTYKPA